jgi:ABC-type antimicrobial peptide transport system permease subunit
MVLRRAAVLIGTGLVIGTTVALALTRLLASQLYETPPADPVTFVVIVAVLAITALVASYLPARRAARVEPVVALRPD